MIRATHSHLHVIKCTCIFICCMGQYHIYKIKKHPKTLELNVILKRGCFVNNFFLFGVLRIGIGKLIKSESKATTWSRKSGKKRCVVFHQCLVFLCNIWTQCRYTMFVTCLNNVHLTIVLFLALLHLIAVVFKLLFFIILLLGLK